MNFRGKLDDGVFVPDAPEAFTSWLKRNEGRRVTFTCKRVASARTANQNSYYWGVVIQALSDWSGHEPQEIHEILRAEFLSPREDTLPDGQTVRVPPSTATLDVEEFSAYLEKVLRWAAHHGVYIPEAGE